MKKIRHAILLMSLLVSSVLTPPEAYCGDDDDCGMVLCCPCLTVGAILYVVTWPVHTGVRKVYRFCQNRPQYKSRRVIEFATDRQTGQKWQNEFRDFYRSFPRQYWKSEAHCKQFIATLVARGNLRLPSLHQKGRLNWEDCPPVQNLIRDILTNRQFTPDFRFRNPPILDPAVVTPTQIHQFLHDASAMEASPERDQFLEQARKTLEEIKRNLKDRAFRKMQHDIGAAPDSFQDEEARIRISDFDRTPVSLPGLADSVDMLDEDSGDHRVCSICLEPFDHGDKVVNCSGCAPEGLPPRVYHKLCYEQGLKIQAQDGHLPLSCDQCKKPLDFSHLDPESRRACQDIAPEHEWQLTKGRFRHKFSEFSQCLGRECMAVAIPSERDKDGYVTCQICTHKQCFQCGSDHPGFTCEQWAKRQKGEEAFSQLVRDGQVRLCYHCKAPVAKIDGCNRIRCTSCKKDFHWDPGSHEARQWHGYGHHNANGTTW